MRDAFLMRRTDRVGEGNGEREDLRQRQTALEDQIAQRLAFDVFHREAQYAIDVFNRVNRDDVGMAQSGNALRLALESGTAFPVGSSGLGEDLKGDVAFQSRIPLGKPLPYRRCRCATRLRTGPSRRARTQRHAILTVGGLYGGWRNGPYR